MQIELTSKGRLYKEGKWQKLDIEYVRDGKKQKRTLVAIGDTKEVVKKLVQDFNEGDQIEVSLKQSEDGQYWNWVDVAPVDEGQAKPKSSVQVKGGWETPEERARKQVYIIRQSSIANALEFHKNDAKLTVEQALATAKKFEQYVFGSLELEEPAPAKAKPASQEKGEEDVFEDDIPF